VKGKDIYGRIWRWVVQRAQGSGSCLHIRLKVTAGGGGECVESTEKEQQNNGNVCRELFILQQ